MKLSKKILKSKFRVSNISLSPKSPRRTPLQQLRRSALIRRSEGVSPSKRIRVDESVRRIDQIAGYFPLERIDSPEKSVSPSFVNDIFNEELDSSYSTDILTNENSATDRDRQILRNNLSNIGAIYCEIISVILGPYTAK